MKITSTDQQIIRNPELSKANGKTQTNTAQNIDENVLAILLKMADKMKCDSRFFRHIIKDGWTGRCLLVSA